jgi:hypothetical protein
MYIQSTLVIDIASLQKCSTFYIVDPGQAKDSCSVLEPTFSPHSLFFHLLMRVIGGKCIFQADKHCHWGGQVFSIVGLGGTIVGSETLWWGC